jgi:hypothetical protein
LRVVNVAGVDPAPFKFWLLPYLQRLPQPLRLGLTAAATALSLPIDALFGRYAVRASWHVVFALERMDGAAHGH